MPSWSPNWSDVRFDHAAAEHAAAACERAARVVRDTTRRRDALAASALAGGRGPWRDQLAQGRAVVTSRSAEVEARLRALAIALREACACARADQLTREADRERWAAEAKAEAARAVQAPSGTTTVAL